MRQTGLVAVFCEFTYRYFLRDVQCATALAYKGLVLLAALGRRCLCFAAVAGEGDGRALPPTPPKEFHPFGIPALAYKGLVLLAALGLLCLWFAAVAGGGDGEALPHAPPKGFYPFGIPTLADKLGLFTYGNHAHFMVG